MRFHYAVWVDCDTWEQANTVMNERLGPDEDYGFDYRVNFAVAEDEAEVPDDG